MSFRKFRRWAHRLFDRSHNEFALGAGTVCEIPSGTDVTETTVRIHGNSKLIVESGASIHQVSFQIDSGSTVRIGAGVVLTDADICIWNQSELTIGKDSRLDHVSFSVEKGKIALADNNVLSSGGRADKARIAISGGCLSVGDHNHLQNSCWIRFGGRLAIGRYNCINAGSELRCDESVTIGSYNMISYNCDIWDTNTHCFYPLEEKKEMFVKDFPAIGREKNKPDSRPVVIGDGNWIGKNACVLKGSTLGNETVVGTRAIVSNMTVEDGSKVVPVKSESLK